jgi:hypothetical protein
VRDILPRLPPADHPDRVRAPNSCAADQATYAVLTIV